MSRSYANVSGSAQLGLTPYNPIPTEKPLPIRKTGYLFSYPEVVNRGKKNKEQGKNYGGIIDIAPTPGWHRDFYAANEVSFSADRVKDARSLSYQPQVDQTLDFGDTYPVKK